MPRCDNIIASMPSIYIRSSGNKKKTYLSSLSSSFNSFSSGIPDSGLSFLFSATLSFAFLSAAVPFGAILNPLNQFPVLFPVSYLFNFYSTKLFKPQRVNSDALERARNCHFFVVLQMLQNGKQWETRVCLCDKWQCRINVSKMDLSGGIKASELNSLN